MSNEPLFSEPEASPPPDAASTSRSADAAMMLAAIDRMESAIRGERIAFERLRSELGEMANAIAQAKSAMQSGAIKPDAAADGKGIDIAALLHELGGRVGAMMEIVGVAAPAGAASMEAGDQAHNRVPTVSDVVSRLGRAGDESMPVAEPGDAAPATHGESDDVPTVSMLETLVMALTAVAPATPPEAAPAGEAAAKPLEEPAAAAVTTEPPAASTSAHDPLMPEIDLLSNFARMESVPYLPPEDGTAVIFPPKTEPTPDPVAAPEPPSEPISVSTPAASEIPPAESQPEPTADLADVDADPGAFLFEPQSEGDADPAAFLLEPVPTPIMAPARPLRPVSRPPPPEPTPPRPKTPAPVPPDPLAPLKAMSAEEKIALFS